MNHKVTFLQSALANPPEFLLPEIAIVGRSNVGKSSLINHLYNQKNLARVSSTPGKTQLLNFFNVDEKYILVDLPGYGYAKVSKQQKLKWGEDLDNYLKTRPLKAILLLLDSRHPPTKEDYAFIEWAEHNQKNLILVFTKTDKVKELNEEILGLKRFPSVNYTIKDGKCRKVLLGLINGIN